MSADPSSPTRGAWRATRASAVALVAVGLAVGCHRLAGGVLPGADVLAATAAVAVGLGWLLGDRRWTAPELLLTLTATQALVHLACTVGAPGHAGAAHHAGHAGPGASSDAVTMLLAHTVATVVAIVVVRAADRALFGLVDLVGTAWRAAGVEVVGVPAVPGPAAVVGPGPTPTESAAPTDVRGRAPPVGLAA